MYATNVPQAVRCTPRLKSTGPIAETETLLGCCLLVFGCAAGALGGAWLELCCCARGNGCPNGAAKLKTLPARTKAFEALSQKSRGQQSIYVKVHVSSQSARRRRMACPCAQLRGEFGQAGRASKMRRFKLRLRRVSVQLGHGGPQTKRGSHLQRMSAAQSSVLLGQCTHSERSAHPLASK